jgi:CheY-like chemotaxis protein
LVTAVATSAMARTWVLRLAASRLTLPVRSFQVRAAEALRESEERFRAIYQHGGIGIAVADLQGRLTSVNPAFQKTLGYAPGMVTPSYQAWPTEFTPTASRGSLRGFNAAWTRTASSRASFGWSGRMKIKSVIGKGSRFHIVVPDGQKPEDRGQKTVGAGLHACPAPGNHGGLPLCVLLADDREIVRQGLMSLLREAPDIEVVGEASNGHEAVNLTWELRLDVLIVDVSMPILSGEEATRQIKGRLPEVRIVALSMCEEPETIERMYQAGAESYVLKTAPSGELLAAIRGKESDSQQRCG